MKPLRNPCRPLLPPTVLVIALLALLAIGCGKPLPPGMVRVTGKVLLDGTPLKSETGALNFTAKEGTATSATRVRPDGGFSVDLIPGEYLVAVRVTDGYDSLGEPGKPSRVAKSLIPARYNDPAESRIAVTAQAKLPAVTLELKSK